MSRTAEPLPAASTGYDLSRFNATRHGVLSRHTVLPWESETEFEALVEALSLDHCPEGPTETHLVRELAGVIWRRMRLRRAEEAAQRKGISDLRASARGLAARAFGLRGMRADEEATREALVTDERADAGFLSSIEEDEAMTLRALAILGKRLADGEAYVRALGMLREDTREWWSEVLEWTEEELEDGEACYEATASDLRRFIEQRILPLLRDQKAEIAARPAIRMQALGEALSFHAMERFARYETHLDRKFERTLAMLVRLKEMRLSGETGPRISEG